MVMLEQKGYHVIPPIRKYNAKGKVIVTKKSQANVKKINAEQKELDENTIKNLWDDIDTGRLDQETKAEIEKRVQLGTANSLDKMTLEKDKYYSWIKEGEEVTADEYYDNRFLEKQLHQARRCLDLDFVEDFAIDEYKLVQDPVTRTNYEKRFWVTTICQILQVKGPLDRETRISSDFLISLMPEMEGYLEKLKMLYPSIALPNDKQHQSHVWIKGVIEKVLGDYCGSKLGVVEMKQNRDNGRKRRYTFVLQAPNETFDNLINKFKSKTCREALAFNARLRKVRIKQRLNRT